MYISCKQNNWITIAKEAIQNTGYIIVRDILTPWELDVIRDALYSVRGYINKEVGHAALMAAGEYGVLRAMMKFEPCFLNLLENKYLLEVVDELLSDKAILHLQNGFILPSYSVDTSPTNFQNMFHRDFPRFLNGYRASVNILFAIDEFTPDNGSTRLVPGSHQRLEQPDDLYMQMYAVSPRCPAGSIIIFDSTLWHAAGINISGKDRLAINHQFTHSFFKPQMDYVRVLGEDKVKELPERIQQLLGFYSRPPTSLKEYYSPENKRMYKRGQG